MITLAEFTAKYTGQTVSFIGCPTDSCMALMHAYIAEVYGLTDPAILATPSAYQVYANFSTLTGAQYFTPIANTPTGMPSPGDIGVIEANKGGALADGHVFVVVSATEMVVTGFSQNWPEGSPAGIRTFTYEGLGWLTPRPQGTFISDAEKAQIEKQAQEAMAFEEMVTSGYNSVNDINTKLQSYTTQISDLQNQVGKLTSSNEALQLEVQSNKDQMAKLADITQQQATSDSVAIDSGLNAAEALKNVTSDINVVASELGTTYPPVKNITGAISTLQNQLKAAQIALTKQAEINKALQASQERTQAVVNASKGFFSQVKTWLQNIGVLEK